MFGYSYFFILSLLYSDPQRTEEPDSLTTTAPGKPAEFVVRDIGKKLTYMYTASTNPAQLTTST